MIKDDYIRQVKMSDSNRWRCDRCNNVHLISDLTITYNIETAVYYKLCMGCERDIKIENILDRV
jgi:late competence protein required for DNA uptake (superfamily II DNA/RNA helicase)